MSKLFFGIFLLGIFSFIHLGYGQEQVLSFHNESFSKNLTKDSYSITNDLTGEMVIVVIEKNTFFAYLYNNDFKPVNQIASKHVKSKYANILGYYCDKSGYHILYANQQSKKFCVLSIDFKSNKSIISEIELDFGEDVFFDTVNYKNDLYILTANSQNEITIHSFTVKELKSLKKYNLVEINEDTNLISSHLQYGVFTLGGYEFLNITKIEPNVPTSIEMASNSNKAYLDKNRLHLTFDSNEYGTLVYTINLDSYDINFKAYPYPKAKLDTYEKFNSFLYNDFIFQMASSKEEMAFEIKSLDGKIWKNYYIDKNDSIDFKNSPIIEEGQLGIPFTSKREMEATKKYLRKITNGHLGISVIKVSDNYYITLGGFEKRHSTAIPVYSAPTNSSYHISYNSTHQNYFTYTYTKSTYLEGIFDVNFNHKKGPLRENVFNRIESFKSEKLKYITAENVFILDKKVYFGYLNLKEQQYYVLKF
ncbi:hypothetical protein LRR18_01005 [Mangrovimonas sp. AS39]|uniref:hypothetical protein n=1 Tax=Mangrovimonas futianensis TaxID=2895523 RepID=UPI001E2AB558|nr:hypothetical protein [Mangrovimonas futianensis]MCF1190145.1 hypothetical protein [Mangrovimonas futianensis]MCF1194104.1 hypothetical protein [Mangrovimonas futianensis]